MKKINQLIIALGSIFSLSILFPVPTQAVCPICTFAVGAGLGISRWLGIDDAITGLWIGALATSSGMWFGDWLKSKKVGSNILLTINYFSFHILLIPTLYLLKIAGNPFNTLWGVDKIILGIIFGSVAFFLSVVTDRTIKKNNNGKVLVYYQKVILPMFYLSILSFIFHLITN